MTKNVCFILIGKGQIIPFALSAVSLTPQAIFPHRLENLLPVFYGIKSL